MPIDKEELILLYNSLVYFSCPLPGQYLEKHHIVPKCLGGVDESNIAQLPFDTHTLAHYYLSLIHKDNYYLHYAYSLMSGTSLDNRNLTPFMRSKARGSIPSKFFNVKTGETFLGLPVQLRESCPELKLKGILSLKKDKKTYKGWTIVPLVVVEGKEMEWYKSTKGKFNRREITYKFVKEGHIEITTTKDLCKRYDLDVPTINKVIHKERLHHKGWRVL